MPADSEKPTNLVPVNELLEIVTEAGLVHQRAFYETSLSNLVVRGGDPLADLSSAYELAAALGIPEERLESVLRTRYPSAADQLAALEVEGATATTSAVARTYELELLRALRQAIPSKEFLGEVEKSVRVFDQPYLQSKWRRDYTVQIHVRTGSQLRSRPRLTWLDRLLRRSPPEELDQPHQDVLLATVQVGNEILPFQAPGRASPTTERYYRGSRLHLVITVGSGVFIKVCAEVLTALRQRFGRHNGIATHEVLYDYVVQSTGQLG